jgi:hypothetical protein
MGFVGACFRLFSVEVFWRDLGAHKRFIQVHRSSHLEANSPTSCLWVYFLGESVQPVCLCVSET